MATQDKRFFVDGGKLEGYGPDSLVLKKKGRVLTLTKTRVEGNTKKISHQEWVLPFEFAAPGVEAVMDGDSVLAVRIERSNEGEKETEGAEPVSKVAISSYTLPAQAEADHKHLKIEIDSKDNVFSVKAIACSVPTDEYRLLVAGGRSLEFESIQRKASGTKTSSSTRRQKLKLPFENVGPEHINARVSTENPSVICVDITQPEGQAGLGGDADEGVEEAISIRFE
eukprot:TRINITY_DN2572_c0_g1_i2.p1 TRINITY_DN2572_c0_g1~~TRINITY_DN2572_c0_g1_i2.p1  ORF type:complete len:226 (+),score=58.66 TRINITY_DN2572_c0_g1_i2:206-883(+)